MLGILNCGEVALDLKKLFDGLGLESFVKVSGSKGLHLTVPINSGCTYEVTQPFANTVTKLMHQQMPDKVCPTWPKH